MNRRKPSAPPTRRDPQRPELLAALARVRHALDEHGLLLQQDGTLPSATTLIAGGPIRGSWWGHPQNKLIYDTLQELAHEVLWVKLVRGKETLLSRRLWPALVSVALSRAEWQTRDLPEEAHRILERVEGAAAPLRVDDMLPSPSSDLVRLLETRLLLRSDSVHTERGHHVRVLQSWSAWRAEHGVDELPAHDVARATLEAAVRGWPEATLPWQS